jgi:chromate transporter
VHDPRLPTLAEATRVWWQIGWASFGGPAAQIATMHRVLVEERRWIGEARFLHALNYCMLLPGPEAQQLATYLGWLMHGYRGGLIAGGLFVLPGFLSLLALSSLYVAAGDVTFVAGLLFGLKAAVLAVVLEAVQRIGKRALGNRVMVAIAVASFVALFVFGVGFPWVVAGAGLMGLVGDRLAPSVFRVVRLHDPHAAKGAIDALLDRQVPAHAEPSWRRASGVLLTLGGAWAATLALLSLRGPDDTFWRIGSFFSGAAVFTFGGAYAVLAWVAQQTVEVYGWLTPAEMLDGLGMAETTPGPLIQVVQHVGFLGAYRNPEGLPPWVAGMLGALLTTWVTYLPCFLWIFLGGPYVERLRGIPALTSALSAITAAVLGVVVNLALWFGLHVLFREVGTWSGPAGSSLLVPVWTSFHAGAAVIAVGSAWALLRAHRPLGQVLAGAAVAGAVYGLAMG